MAKEKKGRCLRPPVDDAQRHKLVWYVDSKNYNGQKIVLQPGEYRINPSDETNGEVIIPVVVY